MKPKYNNAISFAEAAHAWKEAIQKWNEAILRFQCIVIIRDRKRIKRYIKKGEFGRYTFTLPEKPEQL